MQEKAGFLSIIMRQTQISAKVKLYHPHLMVCTAAIIIILIIISMLFFKRYLKKKERKNLIFIIVFIGVIIGAIMYEIYLYRDFQYQLNYDILEYSLELSSNSEKPEIIYFPISANEDLQNLINIKSGIGAIEIFNTEHGLALKVNFTGSIKVYGKLDTTKGIGDHDLTMVNQTGGWGRVQYWVYYQPYNSTNYNCSFKLKLYHESFDWWETHYCKGFLIDSWNTYWADHEVIS